MTRIESNKKLVEKYPFLAPKKYDHDYYDKTGKDRYVIPDNYNYEWTWLDGIPDGWVEAFGEQMCQEIKDELIRCNFLDNYEVIQTKEKYGMLRWYDCGIPAECNVHDIIAKYEDLSEVTCCVCGKPATKISGGWIRPYCDNCAKEHGGIFHDINHF